MSPRLHSIAAALDWGTSVLAALNTVDEPRVETQRLLAAALAITRTELLARDATALDESQASRFSGFVQRRANGEPFAYIVGTRDFWTLSLHVTPAVLVPRPETELLVERALHLGGGRRLVTVLDLGTGSGCVALALGTERADWRITATDRCSDALAVAKANAARLSICNVEFIHSDWFSQIPQRRFDLIASNPPYIGAAEPALSRADLRFEPRDALSPGADGLAALRTLCEQAAQHLKREGWLMLEHGIDQSTAVRGMLVAQGFAHVTSHRDLAGIERVTEAQWRG